MEIYAGSLLELFIKSSMSRDIWLHYGCEEVWKEWRGEIDENVKMLNARCSWILMLNSCSSQSFKLDLIGSKDLSLNCWLRKSFECIVSLVPNLIILSKDPRWCSFNLTIWKLNWFQPTSNLYSTYIKFSNVD